MEQEYVCSVCGRVFKSNKRHTDGHGNTLCEKHASQLRNGRITDNIPITRNDPNNIYRRWDDTYNKEIAEVEIRDKYSRVSCYAKFDVDLIPIVSKYKWRVNSTPTGPYVFTGGQHGVPTILLSRLVCNALDLDSSYMVDHINRDTLDNVRENLRIVTNSQNQMNSEHKGYYINKNTGRYVPQIQVAFLGKIKFKEFEDLNDALLCRWYAEIIIFGQYRSPKDKPVINDPNKEMEIYKYTYETIKRRMQFYFVQDNGEYCFLNQDNFYEPYTVNFGGSTSFFDFNHGAYYYCGNKLSPCMYYNNFNGNSNYPVL